jgi:hypothetical protein
MTYTTDSERERQAAIVGYDFPGLLTKLTGRPSWTEISGPNSGTGLDYWYASNGPECVTAYIHIDQNHASISLASDASDESDLIYEGDLEEDCPEFVIRKPANLENVHGSHSDSD